MAKKAKSPTGKPSKVNPDVDASMRGKGGARESVYSGQPTVKATDRIKDNARAKRMDRGMPLHGK